MARNADAGNKTETITLASGCFWCTEAVFQRIPGVLKVESGYSGGTVDHPTYEQVSSGETGHAEAIQVTFNPAKVTLEEILEWFWNAHDPTTLNRQGADEGTQYRSAIFYRNEGQRQVALASKKAAQSKFDKPIVTEITPFSAFYKAEGYHQNYFNENGSQPYCRIVIAPKLKKLGMV